MRLYSNYKVHDMSELESRNHNIDCKFDMFSSADCISIILRYIKFRNSTN